MSLGIMSLPFERTNSESIALGDVADERLLQNSETTQPAVASESRVSFSSMSRAMIFLLSFSEQSVLASPTNGEFRGFVTDICPPLVTQRIQVAESSRRCRDENSSAVSDKSTGVLASIRLMQRCGTSSLDRENISSSVTSSTPTP